MPAQEVLISADSHINPPETMWAEYLSEPFRERAPRLESTAEGDFVVFEGTRRPYTMLLNLAGRKKEDYTAYGRVADVPAGGWDPVKRIEAQDVDGVYAEVLYGDAAGKAGTVMQSKDANLRIAGTLAFNNWLADFCRYAPERLIGLAALPMDSVDLALSEMRRAREIGFRGVVIPAYPPTGDYAEPEYDALWSAAEDLGLVVNFHLGAWRSEWVWPGKNLSQVGDFRFLANSPMLKMASAVPIALFIFSGILQRHPRLKVVSAESGLGWAAFMLTYMDHFWKNHRHWTHSDLAEPPSYYFRRQVYGTYIDDPVAIDERHRLGVGHIMWSSDYPHSETSWPESRRVVEEQFADVPDADRARIVRENAAELYGIQVPDPTAVKQT